MYVVVYIPKYYSAWCHLQEDWSFQTFMSLDLTSKLIHNLCSNNIDRGFVGALYIALTGEETISLKKLDLSYTKHLH
jgi:hypothetical protein